MQMVMFVLDDPDLLDKVLDAWQAIEVSGVTIIESTGINRRAKARQVGAPFMAGINRVMGSAMEGHYTLFTIVKGEQMVQACIRAAESVVGDLNEPNNGVLASWPLSTVKGVPDDGKLRRA
jgi:hypothetical protein